MIDKILEDREKRYNRIIELIEEYKKPVICGKLNYPGDNKNTHYAQRGFEVLKSELEESFKNPLHKEIIKGYDGSAVLLVLDMDYINAKKSVVLIEENTKIGRIYDLDVYNLSGEPIERSSLGFPKRKCIICGDNPRVCMKEERHSFTEVIDKVNALIENKC